MARKRRNQATQMRNCRAGLPPARRRSDATFPRNARLSRSDRRARLSLDLDWLVMQVRGLTASSVPQNRLQEHGTKGPVIENPETEIRGPKEGRRPKSDAETHTVDPRLGAAAVTR